MVKSAKVRGEKTCSAHEHVWMKIILTRNKYSSNDYIIDNLYWHLFMLIKSRRTTLPKMYAHCYCCV